MWLGGFSVDQHVVVRPVPGLTSWGEMAGSTFTRTPPKADPKQPPQRQIQIKTYLETGSSRCAGHALQRRRPHFTICHLALFPAPWAIICNPSPWRSITRSKNQSSSTKTSTLSLSESRALHKETFHGSQVYLGLNL